LTPRQFGAAIGIAVLLLIGVVVGARVHAVRTAVDDVFVGGTENPTSQALDVIGKDYFHTVDDGQLQNASVRAIVNEMKRKYHDRFSHYFDPHEYGRFKEVEGGGSFSGVGMSVTEVDRGLRVATVFPHSPAKDAGIQTGDVVTAVDGHSIAGKSAELATAEIKGRPGTEVTLTVENHNRGTRDVKLTRRNLSIPAVIGSIKDVDGRKIAYVRLLSFSAGAHGELRTELERLYAQGAQGTILDLRGNGGGLLTEAVLVASNFVPNGTIVSTHGRTQSERVYKASGDPLPQKPMVVLINHDTASASEIVTAALEQAGLAKVVGTRSFGKGTFQEVIPLDNGAALDLTVGEYLTRNGTSINGVGIPPQVKVKDKPQTKPDEGLQQALQVVGSQF
jgi:carboxyl-terminal processing protease